MLHIQLFGVTRLLHGGRPLPSFPTRASQSLFAFLALNRGRTHHRDVLAGTFWGEKPEAVARKNLRTDLWRIRVTLREGAPELESCLVVTDRSVELVLDGLGSVDVDDFDRHLRSAVEAADADARYAHLASAIELYRGSLLEGMYDEWCLVGREHFRARYLDALERAMEHHAVQGDPRRAIEFGARLLSEDPLREHIHRDLMELHYLAGDRAAALRQFAACETLLERELGVEPMAATVEVRDRLLEEDRAAGGAAFHGLPARRPEAFAGLRAGAGRTDPPEGRGGETAIKFREAEAHLLAAMKLMEELREEVRAPGAR